MWIQPKGSKGLVVQGHRLKVEFRCTERTALALSNLAHGTASGWTVAANKRHWWPGSPRSSPGRSCLSRHPSHRASLFTSLHFFYIAWHRHTSTCNRARDNTDGEAEAEVRARRRWQTMLDQSLLVVSRRFHSPLANELRPSVLAVQLCSSSFWQSVHRVSMHVESNMLVVSQICWTETILAFNLPIIWKLLPAYYVCQSNDAISYVKITT